MVGKGWMPTDVRPHQTYEHYRTTDTTMNFIVYENAQPILEEYPIAEALRILLEKHDEFPEKYVEAMIAAAELCLTEQDIQFQYLTYVSAVVQMRMDIKYEQERHTTFSFL